MTQERNSLYSTLPNTIIGFHGCDISTFRDVIERQKEMKPLLSL